MKRDEPCTLCRNTRQFRRGLCRSCYRKLREAGCALPPCRHFGPEPWTLDQHLVAWLKRWPAEAVESLERALAKTKEAA